MRLIAVKSGGKCPIVKAGIKATLQTITVAPPLGVVADFAQAGLELTGNEKAKKVGKVVGASGYVPIPDAATLA